MGRQKPKKMQNKKRANDRPEQSAAPIDQEGTSSHAESATPTSSSHQGCCNDCCHQMEIILERVRNDTHCVSLFPSCSTNPMPTEIIGMLEGDSTLRLIEAMNGVREFIRMGNDEIDRHETREEEREPTTSTSPEEDEEPKNQ